MVLFKSRIKDVKTMLKLSCHYNVAGNLIFDIVMVREKFEEGTIINNKSGITKEVLNDRMNIKKLV